MPIGGVIGGDHPGGNPPPGGVLLEEGEDDGARSDEGLLVGQRDVLPRLDRRDRCQPANRSREYSGGV